MNFYLFKGKKLSIEIYLIIVSLITTILFNISCATSMTPIEVSNKLPNLTKSKFINSANLENDIKTGKCKYLVQGRKYSAPISFTADEDLKNGAKGIDDWVKIDGGNSYLLKNYDWTTVDHNGTTQLKLEFDTMFCND